MQCPHNTILDESNKLVLTGVAPTQMLIASITVTERPGASREPRVFQGWLAGLPTTQGSRKRDDFKPQSGRVGESELVFTVVRKSVPLVCHAI